MKNPKSRSILPSSMYTDSILTLSSLPGGANEEKATRCPKRSSIKVVGNLACHPIGCSCCNHSL